MCLVTLSRRRGHCDVKHREGSQLGFLGQSQEGTGI